MTPRLRIGLTGGIASGKSTVSARFEELGVPVIDADAAARTVVEPGTSGLALVKQRFGRHVLMPDGALNRAALRSLVFVDPRSRLDLNAMLHPLIGAEMQRQAQDAPGPYLVMAIPLLIENGNPHERVDRVLVVDVDEKIQLERLLARDQGGIEQAKAIMASQASRSERLAAADDVLSNSGSVAALRTAVDRLHECYLDLCRTRSSDGQLT